MNEVLTPVVLDTTSFRSTFPQTEGVEVERANLVDLLETMLKGKAPSIHLAGEPGIGKTTLLAQFARKHNGNCVSIFARRSSWFTYDPDFLLRDLCGQMYWLLNRSELSADQDVTDAMLRRLVYSLRAYSIRQGRPIVLVLDGLDELPEQQSVLRELMISKLPLGFDHVKVLTSSDVAIFPEPIRSRGKVWDVPAFGIDETKNYFGDKMSGENIRRLHDVCKGKPGVLAGVSRLLDAGYNANDVVETLPTSMPELFELEWQSIGSADTELNELLALLAHDANKHTVADLALLFGLRSEAVRQKLSTVTLIRVPSSDSEEIVFVSELLRQFASKRLDKYRDAVNRRVVSVLLEDQDSRSALELLPSYLRQTGEHQKLLKFLSPDRFARMLISTHKLGPVQQKVKLGLETAFEIESLADILRFGIQSSAYVEYSGFNISRAEIEARMNLGQDGAALALAQSAVLSSERLRLLAIVARKKKERQEDVGEDLIGSISELFGEVDWQEIDRQAATELASDLLYIRPDLATQVLERASTGAQDKRLYVDFALVEISVQSLAKGGAAADFGARQVRSNISDPNLLSLSSALAQLIRVGGSLEFLQEVKRVEPVKNRLSLIRQWAQHNRDASNAFEIIEYALELGIKTTELTIDARHLRELAQALPLVKKPEQIQALIRTFDTQKATIWRLGPTQDYVHLQLLLGAAESRYDKSAASHRLVDTYLTIADLSDVSVKTTCLARLIDNLSLVDPDGRIRSKEGIGDLAEAEFSTSLTKLLLATADHEAVAKHIIAALVRHSANRAIDVALQLNTQVRRDLTLGSIVHRLLDAPIEEIDLSVISRILTSFTDPDLADEAIANVLERLAKVRTSSKLLPHKTLIAQLCSRVQDFKDPSLTIKGAAAGIACVKRLEIPEMAGLTEKLRKDLGRSWTELDDDADKLEMAFTVASQLASVDKEEACNYVSLADKFRDKYNLSNTFSSSMHCLQLAVRVYAGMLLRKIDIEDDLKELTSRITRLPSRIERATVLTEIALRLIRHEKEAEARRIVNNYLKPLIDGTTPDSVTRYRIICIAAPALFTVTKPSALELINQLPKLWKFTALAKTADFIRNKHPDWEPEDTDSDTVYELTDDEVSELCDLLPQLTIDSSFCHVVALISRTLRSKYGRSQFSQQRRAAVAQRLTELIHKHLPMPDFIKHDGYKILALSEVHRIGRPDKAAWTNIVEQARKIPNVADRALVLAVLSETAHAEGYDSVRQLLDEAKVAADQSCSLLDRINRYQIIAQESKGIDKEFSKELLREALKASRASSEPEIEKQRKDIIDSVYQIDPELASELASAFDDDEARQAKRDLTTEVELLKLKKKLLEDEAPPDGLSESTIPLLPEAAWDLLGSLNAGRILPCGDDKIRSFIKQASALPFRSSFPILSYALENMIVRYKDQSQASRVLRNVFQGVLTAADLFAVLAERMSSQVTHSTEIDLSLPDEGLTVEPGERQQGLDYLRSWLAKNLEEFLWINDPYIAPEQAVEIVRMVWEAGGTDLYIVTSRAGLDNERITKPYSEAFRSAWGAASLHQASRARIIIASVEPKGKAPIKDRWWMSRRSGLIMGTSINGLGERTSRIEPMSTAAFNTISTRLSSIVSMKQRDHDGEWISYESFDL